MKLWIILSTLFIFNLSFADVTGTGEDCYTPSTHQLEESLAPLMESLKSKNNKLFNTLFGVLSDINKYEGIFDQDNDKFRLAYTFYLLKSFADLEEQEIKAEDISSVLSIIKEKYNFEIPQMAFDIIGKIGSIKVVHNSDGSKSIKLFSKSGRDISIDLRSLTNSSEGNVEQKSKSDDPVTLKKFVIKSGAEIRFEQSGQAQNFSSHANRFFERSTITKKKDLITEDNVRDIKNYLQTKPSSIPPAYIVLKGMTIHFDIEGESIDKADLRGGILLPEVKDKKGKPMANFYVGLENISYGFLSLDAELPM